MRRHRANPHALLLLVLLALVSTACGSTVAVGERGALTTNTGGLGAEDVESRASGAAGARTENGSRVIGAGGSQAAGGRPGAPAPGESSAAQRAIVGDGTKQVKIGVYYLEDAQQMLTAVGARSTAPDFRRAAEVMVKDVNARGGIAGRRIIPVYHGIRTQGADRSTEDEAACQDFTRDRPVLAVINIGSGSDILAACLAKAGIVYLYSGLTIDNEAVFRRHPLQSEPISINLDRLARVEVDGLVAQNYLRHAPGSQAASLGRPERQRCS